MEKPSNKMLNSGIDRISELPEALLLHILSFVSTKRAVQTSILSKSWRYLWTNVQNLEFDQREFYSYHTSNEDIQRSSTTRFVNFVDWVLFLHNGSSLGRFKLWWNYSFNVSRASIWVVFAMTRNVQDLILDTSPVHDDGSPIVLPILGMRRLTTPCKIFELCNPVGFSKLRRIVLSSVSIHHGLGQLGEVISNCPLLEDLSLDALLVSNLNITFPNLKRLILGCGNPVKAFKVEVSAPRLVSFTYRSMGLVECSQLHIPSLVAAKISVENVNQHLNGTNTSRILRMLHNVSVLWLDDLTMELLSRVPDLSKCVLPFHNLHSLELKYFYAVLNKDTIQVIGILLNKCPNIETFTIKIFKQGEDQTDLCFLEDDWKPQKLHYDCDLKHLKTLKMYGFDGGKDGLEFVNFLLEKASVLQKMYLVYRTGSPHLDMQMKVYQKICTLPRASSTAKITFCT